MASEQVIQESCYDQNGPIHLVQYASQPYVTILCEGVEHYVYVGDQDSSLPAEVHRCDGGLYTFERSKVTCPKCLRLSLDPEELAREKQASRDQDCKDLASGAKTREQLQRENAAFTLSSPDWSTLKKW